MQHEVMSHARPSGGSALPSSHGTAWTASGTFSASLASSGTVVGSPTTYHFGQYPEEHLHDLHHTTTQPPKGYQVQPVKAAEIVSFLDVVLVVVAGVVVAILVVRGAVEGGRRFTFVRSL
jgi:hypothetical protein